MKSKIKRKIRINEHLSLKEYTGFIFVSNKILPQFDPYKPIKLNITKFFTKNLHNDFPLEKCYVDNKNVVNYVLEKYKIPKKNLLTVDTIFKKDCKIIYLIYLEFNTNFDNYYNLFNMYNNKSVEKNNDLYLTFYKNKSKNKEYKIKYDDNNYIKISLKNIYYYMIANENTLIDLKEYITIYNCI